MKSFLHDGGLVVEIVEAAASAEAPERTGARHLAFVDADEALAWLRRFRGEPLDMRTLRRRLADDGHDVARWGDDEVLRAVAHQVAHGRLRLSVATSWGRAVAAGGAAPRAPAPPPPPSGGDGAAAAGRAWPPAPATPREEPPLDWIEFLVLDDETGAPVRGVELCVALPDGSVRRHLTNAGGLVRVADLAPGTVELRQVIDAEAFEVRRME